jgi:hypothetical protein
MTPTMKCIIRGALSKAVEHCRPLNINVLNMAQYQAAEMAQEISCCNDFLSCIVFFILQEQWMQL